MITLILRSLAAHKRRFVATATAVVLGVAFMAGTLILTGSLGRTFDDLFADINRGTDAYVRSADEVDGARERLPIQIVERVRSVDGVDAVAPVVEGYAQVVGPDGKAVDPASGSPALGVAWTDDSGLNPYRLAQGTAPVTDNEIVIDRRTAERTGFGPGDRVEVLTPAGVEPFEIAGVTTFGDADSPAGATVVGFTLPTAQRVIGGGGRIDAVAVSAREGVAQEELRDRVAAAVPTAEVLTGAEITRENQDEVARGIGFVTSFLLAFALVALFVGAFIIHNTFSIIVAQRTRELALLRALGAGRRQVMGAVVGEAVAVGAVASAAGLVCGLALAQGLRAVLAVVGLEIDGALVVPPAALAIPFAVGVAVCVLSAVMPARRATAIPPIAAMREQATAAPGVSRRRVVASLAAVTVGGVALVAGAAGENPAVLGAGALLLVLGTLAAAPVVAAPVSAALGWIPARLRGVPGRMARDNAARNPRRTAATATALMVGVALVVCASVVASSTKGAVDRAVEDSVTADLVVGAGPFRPGVSPDVAERIASLPGVEAVTPVRYGRAVVDGDEVGVVAYDPRTVGRMLDLDVRDGDLAAMGADGIAVQADAARQRGLVVGDPVDVRFPAGTATLRVAAVYGEPLATGDFVVGTPRFALGYPDDLDQQILVATAGDVAATRAAIESAIASDPTLRVQDMEEYAAAQAGQIDRFLGLIYALLGMAVLIAVIGIVNTLGLSIHERTRELGLLRAVGMSRRQLRASVRWEATIIALFGTLLGLGLGVALGSAAVGALGSTGIETVVLPTTQLVAIALLGALAGVLAATLPARRASRVAVLQAIAAS